MANKEETSRPVAALFTSNSLARLAAARDLLSINGLLFFRVHAARTKLKAGASAGELGCFSKKNAKA